MATLRSQDLDDLVLGTLNNYGPPDFENIAQELQEYVVMPTWLKSDKVVEEGGIGIQRALMDRTQGAASHLGMYEVDDVNVGDYLRNLNVKWVHAQTKWAYELREVMMNKGKALVTKIIDPRRTGAMLDLAAELEDKAWSAPSATNLTDPWGIPYWVVSSTTEGFAGGLPSDHTTVAGVDITASPTFKNYTAQYVAVTRADFGRKIRKAMKKIKFKSPIGATQARGSMGENYRHYCNIDTIQDLEDYAEDRNDNLGSDLLGKFDNSVTVGKNPVVWVPQLDADTSDPFYSINHKTFYPVVLSGDNLRQTGPDPAPGQHNVRWVFIDLTYNFVCINRRRNSVLTK